MAGGIAFFFQIVDFEKKQKLQKASDLESYLQELENSRTDLKGIELEAEMRRTCRKILALLPDQVRVFRMKGLQESRESGTVEWTPNSVKGYVRTLRLEVQNRSK
ncbi:MAG: hypothetical protein ACEQSA_00990 [Weeksellaceae bacterium]